MTKRLDKIKLSKELHKVFEHSPNVVVPTSKEELIKLTFGSFNANAVNVGYDVNGQHVVEATVTRAKNGVVVNYMEDYMRRRDPDCMVIADDKPTDKTKWADRFPDKKWSDVRKETFDWLQGQELICLPFLSGGSKNGYDSLLVCPLTAAFFACGLADLQAFVNIDDVKEFNPIATIFLAPPFRHTHFEGRQVVVHNRLDGFQELFAYNLYPGPSAKKGVYSVLLTIGEEEDWVTCHTSAVRVTTPYENETIIMHEGASGGGKSEMLEHMHKGMDGKLVYGTSLVTGEEYKLSVAEPCKLEPITDDMATCHPSIQNDSGKLVLMDGEEGWFLRVDHITKYGTDHLYESISIHPSEPLVFFNMQGEANSTCLIWEHTLDSTGKPCPNPRVIIPRRMIPNIVSEPVEVDVRSFGVRMPPSSAEQPNYGVMGLMQVVPAALAWLWRLVSPRGHNNPSIIATKGMSGEGVGSYWPFATGLKVKQANLLLEQIAKAPNTNYVLIPNQHIGTYHVGFAPEWVSREFLARVGGSQIKERLLVPARCPLFGYSLKRLQVNGQEVRTSFLQPNLQTKLGNDGYDKGAKILVDFFKQEVAAFNTPDLDPRGKAIIEAFLKDCPVEDYKKLL